MPRTDIIHVTTPKQVAAARALMIDYIGFVEDYLGQSIAFQDTETEFARFPETYHDLWIAVMDGHAVGVVGLKPFDESAAELKRLWVAPAGRGHQLGQQLCEAVINGARARGYPRLLLDTDSGLTHANAVYERLGFTDVAKYYDNPMDSRFMALAL